jgi:hypothetical protein
MLHSERPDLENGCSRGLRRVRETHQSSHAVAKLVRFTHPTKNPNHRARVLGVDGAGWVALIWAIWFGVLYGIMVVQQRAPGLLRNLKSLAHSLGIS